MITENGWPSCTQADLDFSPIPETDIVIPLQKGQPSIVLKSFAGALNKYVESAYNSRGGADEGGWTGTNKVPTSNHLGGTAFDYNWTDHPMGPKVPDPAAGWQGSEITNWQPQEPRIRELLRYYTYKGLQLVWWGNDWTSPNDSMHFQMGYGTYGDYRVQEFIDLYINPLTGLPRFFEDKGYAGVDLVATLSEVMGNSEGVDYGLLLDPWIGFLKAAGCDTVPRIAMAAAQLGEESGGLRWMEEIADGSEYEGRTDLGNTQPGDGKRFKGRGPIQLTGRYNYGKFSQWAYANGYCPTATYYVDHPTEVSKYDIGFLAAAWYWTTHNLNVAADNMDVITATKIINGGDHGLQDRQFRYSRAMQMGDRLLAFLDEEEWMSDPDVKKMISDIWRETVDQKSPSRSFVADDGNLIDTPLGILWNIDGNAWTLVMTKAYELDVPLAIKVIEDIAENGVRQTSWAGGADKDSQVKFNQWLRDFGQAYCQGLVQEKKDKAAAAKAATAKTVAKRR